jgi:hypothetical protein
MVSSYFHSNLRNGTLDWTNIEMLKKCGQFLDKQKII